MSVLLWFKARVDIRIIITISNTDTKTQNWGGDGGCSFDGAHQTRLEV